MFNKLKRFWAHPQYLILKLLKCISDVIPDKAYIQLYYRLHMGKKLNLITPQTFNEKLNWLKLNDRNPLYTKMVDKFHVKEYVAQKIGPQYIIPTIGVWDNPHEIEWDKLPQQFVLKTTHGGGNCGVIICKNKHNIDIERIKQRLQYSLKQDLYKYSKEWPYKNVPRRIIAEEYMSNLGKDIEDYKVHCFNGVPKLILVCKQRQRNGIAENTFYSVKWRKLDISRPGHSCATEADPIPPQLNEMLRLSSILSSGIPFLRCDFYIVNNNIYFGELTFYPAGGVVPYEPSKWDDILGSWLTLPPKLNN